MSYRGHVRNGVVVLDTPAELPEGATVEVEPVEGNLPSDMSSRKPSFQDRYKSVIGAIEGMPPDLAQNHDHYLHGHPRR